MTYLILAILGLFQTQSASAFILEASGVARVGGNLIIGGDETTNALWIESSNSFSLMPVLGGTWDDLEDLTAFTGNQFFAITSHSLTKKVKRKALREQLMLLSYQNKAIELTKSWNLRDQIITFLKAKLGNEIDTRALEFSSFNDGGLNIEGLVYSGNALYLGLRSPITYRGEAIILKIENITKIVNGTTPAISAVMTVPLNNKGIRGISPINSELMILSGYSNDSDKEFGLDTFNLKTSLIKPYQMKGFAELLRPEGLNVETDGSIVFVQDFESPQNQSEIIRLRIE